MEVTPTITEIIAETSYGPKLRFLLFCFHYNGHLGLIK